MADILKISTPLLDKSPVPPSKQVADPSVPFNLSDITKVIQTNAQSEILKQNTGFVDQDASPTILMNMLKDPSVTVGFLHNIFMLQEIIKLLPVNNITLTQEIQQLFDELLVSPEEVVPELIRQENTSTTFKGEFFSFLRDLLTTTPKPEIAYGIANLLKSVNGLLSKRSILDSLSNSLQFLSDAVRSSPTLSDRLLNMAEFFRSQDAPKQFPVLKSETMELLKEVEGSILFTPKMAKVLPLIIYNLSRFSDNPDFLQDATATLLTMVDGEDKKQTLMHLLYRFLTTDSQLPPENSRVMDVLAEIIGKQTAAGREKNEEEQIELVQGKKVSSRDLQLLSSEKIDKIVHSLLSSPCNFTPLLHFIVPVQDEDMRAFAEIWIDPNDEDEKSGRSGGDDDNIHMLIVFDVDGIGRFEAELFVHKKEISLNLLCPPVYVGVFSGIGTEIARTAAESGFRFKDIHIDRLERPRSLMDVFKTLPHKRTGIDVKV